METRKSVLIVDDEEFFGTILRRILEQEGCSVSYCNNPADAIRLSQERGFDVFITDYNMPGMNGAEFASLMRYRFQDSLIVGLSCETMEVAFLASGADAFFEKPIDFDGLLGIIRRHAAAPSGAGAQSMVSA